MWPIPTNFFFLIKLQFYSRGWFSSLKQSNIFFRCFDGKIRECLAKGKRGARNCKAEMPYLLHAPLTPSLSHLNPPSLAAKFSPFCTWNHPFNPLAKLQQKPVVGNTIRCMANPRRVKMVAKQIQRELSDMLLTDKVLQYVVLPEASLGADRYLSSLTTISDVEVSSDLQVVKVYVSVFGDERGKEVAITGLKSKAKYVRSELGRRMKLRLTPEIRFIEDESLERGSRVIAILDRIKNEKKHEESKNEEQFHSSDVPEDETHWNGEEPDEDIIYVE